MTHSIAEVATAVLEALNAESDPYPTLQVDEAKGVTRPHVQMVIAERFVTTERSGRQSTVQGYRVTTRPVAGSVMNAMELDRSVDAAMNGGVFVVNGVSSTPGRRESSEPIAPDEDLYSGYTTWTFAL